MQNLQTIYTVLNVYYDLKNCFAPKTYLLLVWKTFTLRTYCNYFDVFVIDTVMVLGKYDYYEI